MGQKTYKKFDLAANQLRTAIQLFISGGDYFSVITLAGAADVILCELVSRRNAQNFTAFFLAEEGMARTIPEIGREINDALSINDMKHLDPHEDGTVSLNVRECALGAILKALANYKMLEERDENLINAFLAWIRRNLDPTVYNIYCDPNWKAPQPKA